MKIYTRTGDTGETSLFNGARVSKDDIHIECLGAVDETNANVGLIASLLRQKITEEKDATRLEKLDYLIKQLDFVNNKLFDAGACLATPRTTSADHKVTRTPFPVDAEEALERFIDEFDEELPPLTTFVLPSGHPIAAHLHVARTVCRRAERCVIQLLTIGDAPSEVLRFLNRLSDYLFAASRFVNHVLQAQEVSWTKSPIPPIKGGFQHPSTS